MLFALFIYTVAAAGVYPTEPYKLYPKEVLFARDTWLSDLGVDVCARMTPESYRRLLASHGVVCTGIWCDSAGGFSCKTPDCYNVEHIIDKSNSGNNCNTDIAGNYIMAYSRWNQALGSLSWQNAREEKSRVYMEIFKAAYDNVLTCTSGCVFVDDTLESYYLAHAGVDVSAQTTWVLVWTITASVAALIWVICAGAIALHCVRARQERRMRLLEELAYV